MTCWRYRRHSNTSQNPTHPFTIRFTPIPKSELNQQRAALLAQLVVQNSTGCSMACSEQQHCHLDIVKRNSVFVTQLCSIPIQPEFRFEDSLNPLTVFLRAMSPYVRQSGLEIHSFWPQISRQMSVVNYLRTHIKALCTESHQKSLVHISPKHISVGASMSLTLMVGAL
jgi:hypothetical protein